MWKSILGGMAVGAVNNTASALMGSQARQENYEFGEMAAENADKRTRALYNDFYSIPAQMKQLKEAGLSPSVFYGDMAGAAGQSGAMGTGAAGYQNQVFGIDPLTIAQIEKTKAETENVKADTKKKGAETELTQEQVNTQIQETKNKYLIGENLVLQKEYSQIELSLKGEYDEIRIKQELKILGYKADNMVQELRTLTTNAEIAESTKDDVIKFYQNRTKALIKDILLKDKTLEKMSKEIENLTNEMENRTKSNELTEKNIDNWLNVETRKLGISEAELNNDNWRVRLEMIKAAWEIAKTFATIGG